MPENLIRLESFFPFWNQLSEEQREILTKNAIPKKLKKGNFLYSYKNDCIGLILVRKGKLRTFIISELGREITLYRLLEKDICLFSASCTMNNINLNLNIEVEKDSDIFLINPKIYGQLMNESVVFSNFINKIMSLRFSNVMTIMEQALFKSLDSRLATFLLEQSEFENSSTLTITHDEIARNLGSAREVITKRLRQFQSLELISLSRGKIVLENIEALNNLQ